MLILALIGADTSAVFHGIDRIVLGWNVADIRVVSHDKPYVEIRWPEGYYRVDFERKGRSLNVDISFTCGKNEEQIILFGIPLCSGDDIPESIEIRVPRGVKLVAMNGKVGAVEVDGFRGDTLNVNVSILDLEVHDSRVAYLKTNASVGSVEMDDTIVDFLDSDIDIGSVEGDDVHIEKKKVKFLIGSMSLD